MPENKKPTENSEIAATPDAKMREPLSDGIRKDGGSDEKTKTGPMKSSGLSGTETFRRVDATGSFAGVLKKKKSLPAKKRREPVSERLSERMATAFETSAAGALLTSYKRRKRDVISSVAGAKAAKRFSRLADSSVFVNGSRRLAEYLLSLRLKVFGAFLASFGAYTAIYYLAVNFFMSDSHGIYEMFLGLGLCLLSIPLLSSEDTLSSALCSSAAGERISRTVGIRREQMKTDRVSGRLNRGFLAGALFGVLSFFTSPYKVAFLLVCAVAVWLIASRPEFGVTAVAFLIPFASDGVLIGLIAVTAVFFAAKTMMRRRFPTFETVDAAALGVFLLILASGIPGGNTVKQCFFAAAYFLAVNVLKSKPAADRAMSAFVTGCCLACGIFAVASLGDATVGGVSASLAPAFDGGLVGEILSAGDLSEFSYLSLLAMPMTLSLMADPASKVPGRHAAIGFFLLLVPLLAEGVSPTLIPAVLAVLLFFLFMSHKNIPGVLAVLLVAAAGAILFPGTVSRAAEAVGLDFGELLSYRSTVWTGTRNMISEFFLGGIGQGEAVWSAAYPGFAAAGAESAPDAFSIYLQTWAVSGVFGFFILLVFIAVFVSATLTAISKISKARRHPAFKDSGDAVSPPGTLGDFKDLKKNSESTAEDFCRSRRAGISAAFAAVCGILVCGVFDNVMRYHRVFLAFWLVCGLCSAFCRSASEELESRAVSYSEGTDGRTKWDADIRLSKQ